MGNDPWNVWFGPGPGTVAARRRPTPKRVDLHKAISDAATEMFMIQWLTGIGRFDTNDPCDEWPMP